MASPAVSAPLLEAALRSGRWQLARELSEQHADAVMHTERQGRLSLLPAKLAPGQARCSALMMRLMPRPGGAAGSLMLLQLPVPASPVWLSRRCASRGCTAA